MEKNHVVLDLDEYNTMRDEIRELKNSEDKRNSISDRITRAIVESKLPTRVMDKIHDSENTIDVMYHEPVSAYNGFDNLYNSVGKVVITIKLKGE